MNYQIVHAKMEEICKALPDNTFDGLLCDPPYGLKFMNKKWDYDVPTTAQWREVYRVMKPGAYLVAFGGTRTYHRMVCAIEDAGFDIRDQLAWIYGSGMPKSMNASKQADKTAGVTRPVIGPDPNAARRNVNTPKTQGIIGQFNGPQNCPVTGDVTELAKEFHGYGTGLKPCLEPIVLARKPFSGSLILNLGAWGTGCLNIDGSRIEYASEADRIALAAGVENVRARGGVRDNSWKNTSDLSGANPAHDAGRWPGNVIFDEDTAALLDALVGDRPSTLSGRADPSVVHDNPGDNGGASWFGGGNSRVYADNGGPSRFFYVAKANRKERDLGCESLPAKTGGEATGRTDGSIGTQNPRAGAGRTGGSRNTHPTVKPVALTEWLARLILPPGGNRSLFVPFAGVGSEMAGGLRAGWTSVLGAESDPENEGFIQIANLRIPALVAR